ncbi:MAG TPA: response regulator [Novosphingobium sp.]|nr:response regulator [Novosphingobium sp.]
MTGSISGEPGGPRIANLTCLLVEDSRVIRRISRHIVESLGMVVREAEDGQQALAACDAAMPDLILLDWNMPVMNGLEFLRALRARPDGAGPKVVFCTTEYDAGHIREAIASGADEYVMKPFDHDTLLLKLELIGIEL